MLEYPLYKTTLCVQVCSNCYHLTTLGLPTVHAHVPVYLPINSALLELHYILSECTSFVTEHILDLQNVHVHEQLSPYSLSTIHRNQYHSIHNGLCTHYAEYSKLLQNMNYMYTVNIHIALHPKADKAEQCKLVSHTYSLISMSCLTYMYMHVYFLFNTSFLHTNIISVSMQWLKSIINLFLTHLVKV